jgi:hypothetical protein
VAPKPHSGLLARSGGRPCPAREVSLCVRRPPSSTRLRWRSMNEIADGVWQLPLVPRDGISAYLIGDVLVDTGLKQSGGKIARPAAAFVLSGEVSLGSHRDRRAARSLRELASRASTTRDSYLREAPEHHHPCRPDDDVVRLAQSLLARPRARAGRRTYLVAPDQSHDDGAPPAERRRRSPPSPRRSTTACAAADGDLRLAGVTLRAQTPQDRRAHAWRS